MHITAKLLRRDAEDQARNATTEVRRRSAVSRAYCASYHRCQRWEALLPYKSTCRSRGGTHAQLIDRLSEPNPFCGKALMDRSEALGELLAKLRHLRVIADYRLEHEIDRKVMESQIDRLKQVFEKCADPDT